MNDATEESRLDCLEYILCFLNAGLILLHLYLDFFNLTHGIDKGYGHSFPLCSYVLIGAYLLVVLATDIFMIRCRQFELCKTLRKYWGSACIALIVVGVLHFALDRLMEISFLCLLYTPFLVLVPLLEFLGVPPSGETTLFSIAAVGAFCLFNWAVCRFAVKEEKQENIP